MACFYTEFVMSSGHFPLIRKILFFVNLVLEGICNIHNKKKIIYFLYEFRDFKCLIKIFTKLYSLLFSTPIERKILILMNNL